MRIPGLYHLFLLLSRSPERAFERAMLLQRLRSGRVKIALGAAVVLAGAALAGAANWSVNNELECLALNVYFEARGEPQEGQIAVAQVVMNRVADARFPDSVCGVVKQGGTDSIDCQFSWWCDNRADRPKHQRDWQAAQNIARIVYWGGTDDPTGGALWYHTVGLRAYWRGDYQRGPVIGNHVFYRDKPAEAGS